MILYIERYGAGMLGIKSAIVVNTGRRMAWEVEYKNRSEKEIEDIVRDAENSFLKEKRIIGDFSVLDFFLETVPVKKYPVTKGQQAVKIYSVDMNAQSVKCVKDTYTGNYEPDNAMVNQKLEELLMQL